jgi:pimeloyl-ACP methyl ester carboxylesterase
LHPVIRPGWVMAGEQAAFFPREEELAAAIPGAALSVYPDTGQSVHWERPEWVIRDLEAFMKEAPPTQSKDQGWSA